MKRSFLLYFARAIDVGIERRLKLPLSVAVYTAAIEAQVSCRRLRQRAVARYPRSLLLQASIILFVFLSGCADLSAKRFDSLMNSAPYVVSVSPKAGQALGQNDKVVIEFSQAILPGSISLSSLAITKMEGDGAEAGSVQNSEVVKSVVAGKTQGIDGNYDFNADGRMVQFVPKEKLEAASYLIVATNKITSTDLLPLKGFDKDVEAFVSEFYVAGGGSASPDVSIDENGDAGTNADADFNPSSREDDATAQGEDSGTQSDDQSNVIRWPESVLINEVFYDITGDDTNGKVFIELLADGETALDSYKILLINGGDGKVYDTIELPQNSKVPEDGIFLIADAKTGESGVTSVTNADFIANFDPQNGPDCIVVVNEKSEPLDALGYGTPIKEVAETGFACFEGIAAPKAGTNASLTRSNGQDTNDNQTDFSINFTPTPGVL